MEHSRFWGEISRFPYGSGVDMLRAFRDVGFTSLDIIDDAPNHPYGACFAFAATRVDAVQK
jgi:hypothetical protein